MPAPTSPPKSSIKTIISIIVLFFVVGIISGLFVFGKNKQKNNYDYVQVQKINLKQEVNITGKVQAAQKVNLAFEISGKISAIFADVGDKVKKGTPIIQLENNEIQSQLNQAMANLDNTKANLKQKTINVEIQQIRLSELAKGTRKEEISISQTKVDNAQKNMDDFLKNLEEIQKISLAKEKNALESVQNQEKNLINIQNKADMDIDNLYNSISDILSVGLANQDAAINQQLNPLFNQSSSAGIIELSFSIADSILADKIKQEKQQALSNLTAYKNSLLNIPKEKKPLDDLMDKIITYLSQTKPLLNNLNAAVDNSINLNAENIADYKSKINIARININSAITAINNQNQLIAAQKITNQNNITTANNLLSDAKNNLSLIKISNQNNITAAQNTFNQAASALSLAKENLSLKLAGSTTEQLNKQRAQLRNAQAQVESQQANIKESKANIQTLQAKLLKFTLQAPLDGVITIQNGEKGETVSPNVSILSMISEKQFEIKTDVPEVDIAKIKINDIAKTTLDAYGNDTEFKTKVVKIDPAETIIEGIPTYTVTLQFIKKDPLIKSGMTANLEITTAQKQNVLAIPQRAIIKDNGKKFVRILDKNKNFRQTKVTTGLTGSQGMIEIINGVKENDKIITFIKNR